MVAETSSVEVTRSQRLPGGSARRCSAETESGSAQAKMAGTVMECLPGNGSLALTVGRRRGANNWLSLIECLLPANTAPSVLR